MQVNEVGKVSIPSDLSSHPEAVPNCWSGVSESQAGYRQVIQDFQGLETGVRLVHQLSRVGGCEEDMIDPNPDLYGMLYEGITTQERDDQLRYEIGKDGHVWLDKDGRKRPRADFILRKFAQEHPDEEFPNLDNARSLGWTLEEIVRYILRSEIEIGLVTKSKKSKKEGDMPVGKKVNMKRGKGAPAAKGKAPTKPMVKAGTGKVAKPPSRTGNSKSPTKVAKRPAEDNNAEATMEVVVAQISALREEVDELKSMMKSSLGDAVTSVLEKVNEVIVRLDDATQRNLEAHTLMHDLHIQTGGTFHRQIPMEDDDGDPVVDEDGDQVYDSAPLDELIEDEDLLFAYYRGDDASE